MPRLSCWFVRASLLYFLGGFTLGALLLANKGIPFYPAIWNWLPVHMEFLLIGWMVNLAMGVAYWILPRFGQGQPRGNTALPWLAFISLNLGIGLISLAPFLSISGLALSGRIAEAAGVLAYAGGVWPRVKPFAT